MLKCHPFWPLSVFHRVLQLFPSTAYISMLQIYPSTVSYTTLTNTPYFFFIFSLDCRFWTSGHPSKESWLHLVTVLFLGCKLTWISVANSHTYICCTLKCHSESCLLAVVTKMTDLPNSFNSAFTHDIGVNGYQKWHGQLTSTHILSFLNCTIKSLIWKSFSFLYE